MTWGALAALILVLLLAVLDQTIVAIALPTIVGEFNELAHLSWVVTAYLLTSTVVAPLCGKFGDVYGRKAVLRVAIIAFSVGSVLCALSQTMMELILSRGLQGLGGGGLIVTATAAVGDLVQPRERGRYQGIFGAVFGAATIVGPPLGGFLVDHLSWRWIFYVNLPTSAVAWAFVGAVLRSPAARQRHTIDYLGVALLSFALTAIILFTCLGGSAFPWLSLTAFGLVAPGMAAMIAFVVMEGRAQDPILPLGLFRNRTFAVACAASLVVNVALLGAVTYLPICLQVVKGQTPSASGLQLLPMMLCMILTSVISGRMISRWGRLRPFPIAGTTVMTIGLAMLSRLSAESSIWWMSGCAAIVGLGLGMVTQVLVLAAQNSVNFANLGVATSGTALFRSLGGALGVTLCGAIFACELHAYSTTAMPRDASALSTTAWSGLDILDPGARAAYIEGVVVALRPVFIVAASATAVACALTCLLPDPFRGTGSSNGPEQASQAH